MNERNRASAIASWAKRKIPDIDRFIAKIDKRGPNGCWTWLGSYFRQPNGEPRYGAFGMRIGGKLVTRKANRQAWRFFKNEEPGDLHVLHKCDNKSCVNPDHLYLGTHQRNMQDSRERGNHIAGARKAERFVRNEGVVDRVKDLTAAGFNQPDIAKWLGISVNSVRRSLGIRCG